MTLLSLTALAAIIGGFVITAHATDTNSTTPSNTSSTAAVTSDINATGFPFWDMGGMMQGDHGFGRMQGFGRGAGDFGAGCPGGLGNVEVSLEYTQQVTNILNNDTDVQNLTAQGYNITSITPIIKNVIGSDGTLIAKATTVVATLENGTSGYATVKVDVEQAKVTQIVIVTRTVIDKSTT